MDRDENSEPNTSLPLSAPRKSIQEFWIDFLLEEEFGSNQGFADHVLSECGLEATKMNVKDVERSYFDQFGEADLVVYFEQLSETAGAIASALLIENKITAPFQPNQAERYRLRGEHGKQTGKWADYRTILVAPLSYISNDHGFDKALSLEQIKPWICPNDLPRQAFKRTRIDTAIKKVGQSGVQNIDPIMTEFREKFYQALISFNNSNQTDFAIREPKPTWWDDQWFDMKSKTLPEHTLVRYMARSGKVALILNNVALSETGNLKQALQPDMKLEKSGKYLQHTSIRLKVTPILSFENYADKSDIVSEALLKAKMLRQICVDNRAIFESILTTANQAHQ